MQSPPRAEPAALEGELIRHRRGLLARINGWRKRTPFNPYWIERKHLRRAAARLAPLASGRLLDVGGGERPYGALFAPYVKRYVGLEYPPMADNLAPEIWRDLKRVRAIIDVFGDGYSLPFAEESFETVLCSEVLEHVSDPERILREIGRVLKPGGVVLLTVPFMAPLHQLPLDYYRFTPRGLVELIARSGMELEWIEPRGNAAAATGSLLSQYLLRLLGSRKVNHDGSVMLSRWRAPLILPVLALIQLWFDLLARWSSDHSTCLGYTAAARRPRA